MSKITFYKYQGTGNDFIIIDNRNSIYQPTTELSKRLCDRKFGIGADGLICLQPSEKYDFEMLYFNSDGNESTMCGNGGRCLTAFAKKIGVIENKAFFNAIDGEHEAIIQPNGWVELKMQDVKNISIQNECYILNTGSPHFIRFVEKMTEVDVNRSGAAIRYSEPFKQEGINVNFVEEAEQTIKVATYERGVEGETLSCGTGVTAAAIAFNLKNNTASEIFVETKGGNLSVKMEKVGEAFRNVWLCGPATFVFKGEVEV